MCVGDHKGQQRMLDSLELELPEVVSCRIWMWRIKLYPLQQQQMLLPSEPPSIQQNRTAFVLTRELQNESMVNTSEKPRQ